MASVNSFGACRSALDGMQPAVNAHAARVRLAVDEGDLHAEVRSKERRGVAPGAGAEDSEFGRVGGHGDRAKRLKG